MADKSQGASLLQSYHIQQGWNKDLAELPDGEVHNIKTVHALQIHDKLNYKFNLLKMLA